MREAMATITSVVQDEPKEESENGGLAMDLGNFEASWLLKQAIYIQLDVNLM